MNRSNRFGLIGGLLTVALVLGPIAMATTIKSASHYGFAPGHDGITFQNCHDGTAPDPCEVAQTTNQLFTINGVTGNIIDFTTGLHQDFQVFDIRGVSANTVISLPFANWGLLTCGFGNGATSSAVASDGSSAIPGLPCTPIDDVTGTGTLQQNGSTLYSTQDAASNPISFTINADGSITFITDTTELGDDVVLWAEAPSTTTPEPASVALLGTGLATLIGLRRRKR